MRSEFRVVAGAVLGGLIGCALFFWLAGRGYYGLIVPGGLLGLGAGIGRSRSWYLAAVCGAAALVLGLWADWQFAPFIVDRSFAYFVRHVWRLDLVPLGMILTGALIAFWVPFRRRR